MRALRHEEETAATLQQARRIADRAQQAAANARVMRRHAQQSLECLLRDISPDKAVDKGPAVDLSDEFESTEEGLSPAYTHRESITRELLNDVPTQLRKSRRRAA